MSWSLKVNVVIANDTKGREWPWMEAKVKIYQLYITIVLAYLIYGHVAKKQLDPEQLWEKAESLVLYKIWTGRIKAVVI